GTKERVLLYAASAEQVSEHPLGQAIVKEARAGGLKLLPGKEFKAVPGQGIRTRVEDKLLRVGNLRLMEIEGLALGPWAMEAERLSQAAMTPMLVAVDQEIVGIIAVADGRKEGSRRAVNALKQMGLEVVMVTGDNRQRALSIAQALGRAHV